MRVPDPEDPKYREPKNVTLEHADWFDVDGYVRDFRKWKAELRQRFHFIDINCDRTSHRAQTFRELLLEILGEEASER